MEATKAQLGYIKGLLKAQGVEVETSELESLTKQEANDMIRRIKGEDVNEKDTPERRMKRKIMSMAHTIKWEVEGGKVDMDAIDDWCIRYGQYHKKLDKHTILELPHLVSQFQQGPFKSKLAKYA